MNTLESLLAEHPFFAGMERAELEIIAACGANVRFAAGEYLFREGEPADRFYLVRHGHVALEFHTPDRGPIATLTTGPGEVVGFSWLLPPYRWIFDARALELTRVIAFDGACLREKCERDPKLGYDLMKRAAQVVVERLQAARVQLLDVYGEKTHAR